THQSALAKTILHLRSRIGRAGDLLDLRRALLQIVVHQALGGIRELRQLLLGLCIGAGRGHLQRANIIQQLYRLHERRQPTATLERLDLWLGLSPFISEERRECVAPGAVVSQVERSCLSRRTSRAGW